jgi:hypothetical protein
MFDPSWIGHFSRCHCVAICAALVPLNLLVSALVIGLVARDIAPRWRRLLALGGLPLGGLLVAHVASWWVVGVVALPTIILPTLASVYGDNSESKILGGCSQGFYSGLGIRPTNPFLSRSGRSAQPMAPSSLTK